MERPDSQDIRSIETRSFFNMQETTVTGFTDDELEEARRAPNKTITTRPRALGYTSIVLIIVNRMVGSGIFRTPSTLAHETHSVGYSLVLWAIGGIVAISGAHVFTEFGLTVPRLDAERTGKQSVARNGGEKNYLEYMLKKPRYLATCIYGIPFLILGNMAGNALVFAQSVLCITQSATYVPPERRVALVAILAATFASLLHATWRSGGIIINNIFGAVKLTMLLAIFVLGIVFCAGKLGGKAKIAGDNLSIHKSFKNASASPYGYAQSFLAIIFAYGGFNQANYVLGEIDNPRRKFKRTMISTVAMVSLLYILVNLAYMMVVAEADQIKGTGNTDTVASGFFSGIFGKQNSVKAMNSFLAFSSLGNIIVQTFTATRVKQEIAKEGILPFAKFFASNYSVIPRRFRPRNWTDRDETPVGAFLLHWTFAVTWILALIPAGKGGYRLFVSLYSFTIDAIFGFLVGASIIYLRLTGKWSKKSTSNKYVSFITAIIYTLANLFPLIAIWFPPPSSSTSSSTSSSQGHGPVAAIHPPGPWFITATIGLSTIGLGLIYWILLTYVIPLITARRLNVEFERSFVKDHGYYIMWHEIVSINWWPK